MRRDAGLISLLVIFALMLTIALWIIGYYIIDQITPGGAATPTPARVVTVVPTVPIAVVPPTEQD